MSISSTGTFRAFRSSNYALYFIGRSVSQFGTAMQQTAVVWIVYSLTHSAFMLGITVFAEQFPAFLLSVFGGIVADRYNRYTIVKITQIASIIQATLLTILVFSVHYVIWQIMALSVILGIINAFDIPARQAMTHEVVEDKADLPNAISLNSAMASLAKLLGPALAGITLERFGAGICFLSNALSFGGVMVSLMLMKLPTYIPPKTKKKVFAELVDGFVYLKQVSPIGIVIIFLAIDCLFVVSYSTLLPVFAKDVFKGNAATFGYITSFIGVGAVVGTLLLAILKRKQNLRKLLLGSALLLGVGLITFSYAQNFYLAMAFAVICGLGTTSQVAISNIIVQSESAENMRGRAISIMIMAIVGMVPLGSLFVGWISEKIGAPETILLQGIIALVIVGVFAKRILKK